jgi:enoyl-CoA hydratase/carnithine racemase
MPEYKNIEVTRDKKTAVAAIKAPLNRDTVHELLALMEELAVDKTAAALVISGDFGAAPGTVADGDEMGALCDAVEGFSRPVIAAITVSAQGPGFELALACDLRVSAETTRFGFPGTTGGPATRLAKLVGVARAKHMALTGQIIDALEAERLGLLSHTSAESEVTSVAKKLAKSVAARASRK